MVTGLARPAVRLTMSAISIEGDAQRLTDHDQADRLLVMAMLLAAIVMPSAPTNSVRNWHHRIAPTRLTVCGSS